MEPEQADQHSRLTLSRTGAAVMRINPDGAVEDTTASDAKQVAALKEAGQKRYAFCEPCEGAKKKG